MSDRAKARSHDDHIWLTFMGEAWAIHSIIRLGYRPPTFILWRGYMPNIEVIRVDWPKKYWPMYADLAVEMLAEQNSRPTLKNL